MGAAVTFKLTSKTRAKIDKMILIAPLDCS